VVAIKSYKSESINYRSSKEDRMTSKVWFITGTSRGFGRIWAEAALTRGDKVAATARTVADVADLKERFGDAVLPLALDVTDADQARHAVRQAHAHFGKLDVVLNNVAYSLVGTVEEASEADVRALFDTNCFGQLRVIQAALPLLRQQGSGHILGVSSSLGIAAMPLIGFYCATKWAVEALHESLAKRSKALASRLRFLSLVPMRPILEAPPR
jgi:NADP-dependent 3-hydroxy acid dehydrogenase YdfG